MKDVCHQLQSFYTSSYVRLIHSLAIKPPCTNHSIKRNPSSPSKPGRPLESIQFHLPSLFGLSLVDHSTMSCLPLDYLHRRLASVTTTTNPMSSDAGADALATSTFWTNLQQTCHQVGHSISFLEQCSANK